MRMLLHKRALDILQKLLWEFINVLHIAKYHRNPIFREHIFSFPCMPYVALEERKNNMLKNCFLWHPTIKFEFNNFFSIQVCWNIFNSDTSLFFNFIKKRVKIVQTSTTSLRCLTYSRSALIISLTTFSLAWSELRTLILWLAGLECSKMPSAWRPRSEGSWFTRNWRDNWTSFSMRQKYMKVLECCWKMLDNEYCFKTGRSLHKLYLGAVAILFSSL